MGLSQVLFENSPLLRGLVIYEMGEVQLTHCPANFFLRAHPQIRGLKIKVLTILSHNNVV
ncbi:MAG: hypothetical protein BAJALOKI1v1_110024 [Promethearchaeota archaeon]|nr:MAG: hypothetical protein BAJALOKI1v1_110024 [Candidatus Lokiarchaeota archaeon]